MQISYIRSKCQKTMSDQDKLRSAIEEGDVESVRLLLTSGAAEANVRFYDGEGYAPLDLAVYHNCTAIVKCLLRADANPNLRYFHQDGPALVEATRKENLEVVRLLLKSGANVNDTEAAWHNTALHIATVKGAVGIMQVLLDHGADTNLRCCGLTPLERAVHRKKAESVAVLQKHASAQASGGSAAP